MKRKLVYEDLIELKKLLGKLQISSDQVSFDLREGSVETTGETFGQHAVLPASINLRPEEEIIALISDKNGIPESTGQRYLHYFRDYFDQTEQGKIAFSPYNIKLLQTIDQLITRGLAPEEVSKLFQEGESLSSADSASYAELTREYFNTTEQSLDTPWDDQETAKQGLGRKAFKWSLVGLVLLFAVVWGSYQMGYLEPLGFYPRFKAEAPPAEITDGETAPDTELKGRAEQREQPDEEIPEPAEAVLMPGEITVDVLNGSGSRGVAGLFAEQLRQLGYQVEKVENAAHFNYNRSQVISRLQGDEAWAIQSIIPQAELLHEAPAEGKPMVTVILGKDYE